MVTPKINQPDPVATEEDVVIEAVVEQPAAHVYDQPIVEQSPVVEQPAVVQPVDESVFSVQERIPSTWDIRPGEGDGVIEARNSTTNRLFVGTIEEFNLKLKG